MRVCECPCVNTLQVWQLVGTGEKIEGRWIVEQEEKNTEEEA